MTATAKSRISHNFMINRIQHRLLPPAHPSSNSPIRQTPMGPVVGTQDQTPKDYTLPEAGSLWAGQRGLYYGNYL